MKNKNAIIGLIVILALLGLSLVFGMVFLLNKNIDFSFGFDFGTKNVRLVDTFDINGKDIKEVDLNLYSSNVEIKESVNDNLKIEYYSNKETANVIKKDNDRVYIDEDDSRAICIGICSNHRRVVIYVPTSYSGSFNIETASGDVKSSVEVMENDIDIETRSGDVYLKDITYAQINTTSGDIEVNNAHKLNIETTSGDIIIRGEVGSVEIETRSGDIDIDKISKYLRLDTTSGDIHINSLDITENSSIDTTSGDIKIKENTGDCYIDFSSMSGDNHINKNNRKSEVELVVKTTSGDIRVN